MKPEITRRDEARRDLLDAYVYIGQRNEKAAERFLDSVEQTILTLSQMPGMGRARDFGNPALAGMRMRPVIGFDPWLVFYRQTDTGIEVIRVLHGARDLQPLFDEME